MYKPKFVLIGMDDCPNPHFSEEIKQVIQHGKVFSGGLRHAQIVQSLLPAPYHWIPVTVPLEKVWQSYRDVFEADNQPVVVFVSGDPLFFGFANTLMRVMPEAELRIYPAFNSLQLLAHRIPLRYDDMWITSLTGRPWEGLDEALISGSSKIGVLTDRVHTPAAIAARMLAYGYAKYKMYVGEHLGNPTKERVRCWSLPEAVEHTFECPNCVILEAESVRFRSFGIPDESFQYLNGRSKMITKMPIRLLALQALELPVRKVLWDIGFCTGSVSIEARLLFPHLKICSFEIRPECEAIMQENCRRLGAPGIDIYMGDFLETDLCKIPAPDAVFIGGHGGQLKRILQRVLSVLQPGGCVVFNAVSAESQQLFVDSVQELGLHLLPARHIVLDTFNPITILKACYDSI